jgi:hypothetical protein
LIHVSRLGLQQLMFVSPFLLCLQKGPGLLILAACYFGGVA